MKKPAADDNEIVTIMMANRPQSPPSAAVRPSCHRNVYTPAAPTTAKPAVQTTIERSIDMLAKTTIAVSIETAKLSSRGFE